MRLGVDVPHIHPTALTRCLPRCTYINPTTGPATGAHPYAPIALQGLHAVQCGVGPHRTGSDTTSGSNALLSLPPNSPAHKPHATPPNTSAHPTPQADRLTHRSMTRHRQPRSYRSTQSSPPPSIRPTSPTPPMTPKPPSPTTPHASTNTTRQAAAPWDAPSSPSSATYTAASDHPPPLQAPQAPPTPPG